MTVRSQDLTQLSDPEVSAADTEADRATNAAIMDRMVRMIYHMKRELESVLIR